MSLDRSHLQLLAAIRRMGRLGDAARALHISPSAASHRLAEAERRAAIPLTESTGRTLKLTPAGDHLARSAAEVEDQIERALLTARWVGGGDARRVRVAVGFYDTAGWLLDAFAPIDGSPRIELLRFGDDGLLDAVRTGQADVAISPWHRRPTGPGNVGLATDRLVAAVPAGGRWDGVDPIAPADLETETFLTSDYRPSHGFEFHEFFLAADVIPTTVVQVQSLEVMLRLVGRGEGVTIQPSLMLTWNRSHSDVSVVPLAGRPIELEWVATHRAGADDAVSESIERIADAFARRDDAVRGT